MLITGFQFWPKFPVDRRSAEIPCLNRREAHDRTWLGRSTVRSLRPSTAFHFIGLALDPPKPDAEHRYTATDITHLGINNLSGEGLGNAT